MLLLFCTNAILGPFQHDSSDFKFLLLDKERNNETVKLKLDGIRVKRSQNSTKSKVTCVQKSIGNLFIIQFLFGPYFELLYMIIVVVLSGLMVSAVASGPGSSPNRGHCVVLLGKTHYSQCLSPSWCINRYRQYFCWE